MVLVIVVLGLDDFFFKVLWIFVDCCGVKNVCCLVCYGIWKVSVFDNVLFELFFVILVLVLIWNCYCCIFWIFV